MVRADIEVLMRMTLEEAIILRDDLEGPCIMSTTTPHWRALNEAILAAQKLAAA